MSYLDQSCLLRQKAIILCKQSALLETLAVKLIRHHCYSCRNGRMRLSHQSRSRRLQLIFYVNNIVIPVTRRVKESHFPFSRWPAERRLALGPLVPAGVQGGDSVPNTLMFTCRSWSPARLCVLAAAHDLYDRVLSVGFSVSLIRFTSYSLYILKISSFQFFTVAFTRAE